MALIGNVGPSVVRVPRPTILGRILDAAWIVAVVLVLPVAILVIGTPLAYLAKLLIDLF